MSSLSAGITRNVYGQPTGGPLQQINDVNTSVTTGVTPGWTNPASGGLNLITDDTLDSLGRRVVCEEDYSKPLPF